MLLLEHRWWLWHVACCAAASTWRVLFHEVGVWLSQGCWHGRWERLVEASVVNWGTAHELGGLDETWVVHTVEVCMLVANLRIKAWIWILRLQQPRLIGIKWCDLFVIMMIFIPFLTPTRRLFHQQLPILSAASQVIKPCWRLSWLLIATYVSTLYRSILGSLLIHLEQLIVVLTGPTRVNLKFFFVRGHSLTGKTTLSVWTDTQELPIVAVSHCFHCIVLMSRLFLSHGVHLLCQLVDLTKVFIGDAHLLSCSLKVWCKAVWLLRTASMRKFWKLLMMMGLLLDMLWVWEITWVMILWLGHSILVQRDYWRGEKDSINTFVENRLIR